MNDFKSKLSNYWYHYKWHTLVALFFTVFITVMIVQMASRGKEDISIMYAGPEIISDTQRDAIADVFEQIMPKDYDGNGNKSVDFMDIILLNHEQLKQAYADGANQHFLNEGTIQNNKETLSVQARAGDYVIFIIGEEWYRDLYNGDSFLTFDEQAALGIDISHGERYDNCAYKLHSLEFAKFYTQFESFPEDSLVCIRRKSAVSAIKGAEKAQKHYDRHIEYFNALLSFTAPTGE